MKHSTTPTNITTSLIEELCQVSDNRSDQGKRHSLGLIPSLVLLGFLKGKTSLEACCDFDRYRYTWYTHWFGSLPHGIPEPTTVSRALSITNPQVVVLAINRFFKPVSKFTTT